ncbi:MULTISPECIES: DUF3152 domain-containing protein [Streptomyces]|uniref:DUF3152 domain-containing protein n=1 Tax=Streptomyces TaxID=1883 RepID=UPI00240E33EA|nr:MULTISPECIES: DUF3152 domain-containing protein [Streptomyces]WFB84963.1 DUF3152 domain-containing protein [Streptomyces olivaceus]WGK49415.1 DUF3152 domain-containing protein [Streptomyces sp. B146]
MGRTWLACLVAGGVLLSCGSAYGYWRHSKTARAVARCLRTPAAASHAEHGDRRAVSVPVIGPGTFATAAAEGRVVGTGARPRRYQVQVEDGSGVVADAAARETAGILGDPRGWGSDGVDSFRLVASGPRDFVVEIATSHTVDCLCGAAGLDTHGEVNCSVDRTAVVNLGRWLLGSPEFGGPIEEYRALIINHEVGHRIGHGHETCPGAGRPAPVMLQQIKGLKGCVANAWPFDADGRYLGGPHVS